VRDFTRTYKSGEGALHVLNGVDLDIEPGEIVGLIGPSGSGKSSLLHGAGLLERPSSGEVFIDGVAAWALDDRERTALRRGHIGFVYQFHHLLAEFDARDNVALPRLIAGASQREARAEAERLLDMLGLAHRVTHQPPQLSGGEQQRVAIARALANRPSLLLADEPTGNLDPPTAERVFDQLISLIRRSGVAAVIATHNLDLAARMDRTLRLMDGLLVEEEVAVVKVAST
jgi:lipoprotein-releasing system ATP-binding protein